MRKEKTIETTVGSYTIKELTPTHIADIKETGTKIVDALRVDSKQSIAAKKEFDLLLAQEKPKAKTSDIVAAQAKYTQLKAKDDAESNLRMMTDAPDIIENLSGDCLKCSNDTASLAALPFSELAELWEAFKEINSSFLSMVPLHLYAETLVSNLKSDLLQKQPKEEEA